jgi:hypothetical protein
MRRRLFQLLRRRSDTCKTMKLEVMIRILYGHWWIGDRVGCMFILQNRVGTQFFDCRHDIQLKFGSK